MRLYFDGWYAQKTDAQECLDLCKRMGAIPIGVIESQWQSWGLFYFADHVLFETHRIDDHENAIYAPVKALAGR